MQQAQCARKKPWRIGKHRDVEGFASLLCTCVQKMFFHTHDLQSPATGLSK